MTGKKKNGSSTESSSASSSGSSSSSSSSSGSDSSSSSDTDSSSSRESAKNSGSESPKKINPSPPKTHRKSTDSSKTPSNNKAEVKPSAKAKPQPVKQTKPPNKAPVYSDDESEKKQVKRKNNVKPKSSATLTPKPTPNASQKTTKSPPKSNQSSKTPTKPTNNKDKGKQAQKAIAKIIEDSKKKSIFSPENSSDSDSAPKSAPKSTAKPSAQAKGKPEPRPKAAAKPVEKPKVVEKKPEKVQAKTKPLRDSSASSASSSSASSSSSDSESSAESSEKDRKIKKPVKKPTVVPKEEPVNSDSEVELNKSKQNTRKLTTRSASTRKSKHVLGKNVFSDTDSDTESTKRSLSRSPVKKAPIVAKGKSKNKREESKKVETTIVERKCPLEGCDSSGHLSGKFESHFTLEACPLYHNTTPSQCKTELSERKKREETRKKALEIYSKSQKSVPTLEQKQYLTKIKELRTKFKMEPVEDIKPIIDKNKEPDLTNFVPEYDLKLFRDAQAVVSEKIEDDLKSLPSTKGTKYIEMGKFDMEVWYQSPYPEDYARLPKLYICEYCLRYMKSRTILQRHVMKCVWRHPPGEEVYRKDKISVWEVDGKRYKQYCQNLCLLAKFFLDHKTLYYDVEPFLFYVMTMIDNEGCHTVGYFSKEKNSFLNYNVSCILTLPPYQRQGYGRLLIDFSYLLTRVEGKIGSPEKPLSDLGLISYRSYWKDVLLSYLCSRPGTQLSVKDISQEMAIHSYDIVSTLQALGMMKYWKGKHIILKKQDVLDEYVERVKRRGSSLKKVDPDSLRWIPPQPAPA